MQFDARLTWTGNRGGGTVDYEHYGREWTARVEGKPDLDGSAATKFRGDGALHDPEDLLVIALSSCHLLSYLALCARKGVRVLEYSDAASGTMALERGGSGRFTDAILRPQVTIAAGSDATLAAELHHEAHASCFIANSCNFPVRHEATITVAQEGR